MVNQKSTSHKIRNIVIAVAVVLLVIIGIYYFRNKNITVTSTATTKSSQSVSNKPKVVGATSKPTPHISTNNNSEPTGTVVNNNGEVSNSLPPSSEWTSSTNGDITLQQPTNNSVLTSGDSLSGTANVSNVSFILTDNAVGVIDQGNLSVVNGKFSGTLHFTSTSSSGTLQVYYPNPSNGAEEDIININIKYST